MRHSEDGYGATQSVTTGVEGSDVGQFAVPMVYTHQGYKNLSEDSMGMTTTETSTDSTNHGTDRHTHVCC